MPQLNVILCATLCVAAIGWRPLAKAPSAPRAIARIGATATDARRTSPDSIQFNADKLQMGAHRYDLVMTLRGEEQTIGWSDVALTRSGDTVRFTEALAWPATGLSQRVEVLFHARSLAVQLHTSDMTSGLQRAHSTVSFVGGRATGRVQQLLPLSVSSREVDLPMDENVTDDAIAVARQGVADNPTSGLLRMALADASGDVDGAAQVARADPVHVPRTSHHFDAAFAILAHE